MAVLKCKMCGGTLELTGESAAVCEYCGTRQTLPKTTDETLANLYNRANNLRLKCEFDRAQSVYEKIVEQDVEQAEAHWGIVLCKYGIEYVEDPRTAKRVPTCHRTLFEAVTADADYEAAIDYADTVQQEIYKSEARAIDRIQKDILAIVKNEKPFDVFLCYKETDFDGKRTQDSVIANEIYHQLTQEGFKVFYAAITLEDKLGQEYEPYIFAALHSAKVMLVIGTKPEFFDAVWVRNEWSRFLHLAKDDRQKLLIPCYRDMDAYDLPAEFSHLQAQDMTKIGFINDIVRGIRKVLVKEPAPIAAPTAAPASAPTAVEPLLERAFMFLEDGNWSDAADYANRVLDLEPKNARAYLALLMADLKVRNQDDLQNCAQPFDANSNYQKAVRFGDEKLKTLLAGYIEYIKTRNENARLKDIYDNAKERMAAAGAETAYKEAARLFESLGDYADAAVQAQTCYEKAEAARKDVIYDEAKDFMLGVDISNCEEALRLFESISGWKDADKQATVCQKMIEELKKQEEADRLERERRMALEQQEAEARAKRIKKIASIATPIIGVVIVLVIVWISLISPLIKKHSFIAEYGQNAYDAFGIVEKGAYITFGAYEQDNDVANGKESVEWLVLDIKDGKALVISKFALACLPYHDVEEPVTWETCTLRRWLNEDFISTAFSKEEGAMIATVTVAADSNPKHNLDSGNKTKDQLFLLSINEVNMYLSSSSARQCLPTVHAVAQGAWKGSTTHYTWWWLRTRGITVDSVAYVYIANINANGLNADRGSIAVRPAMWIDLNA